MAETFLLGYVALLALLRYGMSRRQALRLALEERGLPPSTLERGILAGLLVWLLMHCVARLAYVSSRSMLPTLGVHDVVVVDRLHYLVGRPERGDLALFQAPAPPHELLLKRIVGLAGDRVAVREGGLFVNGERQSELYLSEPGRGDYSEHLVQSGCFFAMGDNRNQSSDSRAFGDVSETNLIGRAAFRLWPLSRAGWLR